MGAAERRVTIVVNGPDPVQTAWWNGLADRTALELSGLGAPLSRRLGMKGSPGRTWYGDLGPLQVPAPSYGARNTFAAENAGQALPATSSPSTGSLDIRSIVAEFGL